MHADPFSTILAPILNLLNQALPKDLASSIGTQIESAMQQAFKKMTLVPKHEFEAQEALLATLEAQVAHLEARLRVLESAEPTDLSKSN
jgi:BMFP domain-containing protein YqiC